MAQIKSFTFLPALFSVFVFTVEIFGGEASQKSEQVIEVKERTSSRFGPGKAVEAFSKEDGFKLSEKAMTSLGVKFSPASGNGPWRVPKEAIVHIKQSDGVYRRYDGWISLVLVKVVSKDNDSLLIQSADLESEDQVAISCNS